MFLFEGNTDPYEFMPSNPFGETPLNKDEKEKIERLDSIIRECKELGRGVSTHSQ